MPTTKTDRSQELRAYQIANAAGKLEGQPVMQKKLDAITLGEIVKRDNRVGGQYAYRIVEVEARDGKILNQITVEGGAMMTLEQCTSALSKYKARKKDTLEDRVNAKTQQMVSALKEMGNRLRSKPMEKQRFVGRLVLEFNILAEDRQSAQEIMAQIKKAGGFTHDDEDMGIGMIVLEHPVQADLLTIEREVFEPAT